MNAVEKFIASKVKELFKNNSEILYSIRYEHKLLSGVHFIEFAFKTGKSSQDLVTEQSAIIREVSSRFDGSSVCFFEKGDPLVEIENALYDSTAEVKSGQNYQQTIFSDFFSEKYLDAENQFIEIVFNTLDSTDLKSITPTFIPDELMEKVPPYFERYWILSRKKPQQYAYKN